MLKFPKISLARLKLKNLSLTTASFELETKLENPNNLSLILNRFQYNLTINNRNWLSGIKDQAQPISSKASQTLTLPFAINFLDIGQSVYQAIVNNESLDYHFSGNLNVGAADLPLSKVDIPFLTDGRITLQR